MDQPLVIDSLNPQGRPMSADEQADYDARAAAHEAKARPDALDALAAMRVAVMAGGVAVPALGFSIKTDDVALARIGLVAQAVAAGVAPPQIPWKAADGKFHAIAPADVAKIFIAGAAHVAACFVREAALAQAIAAADNPTSVDISGGWPANG